MGQRDQKFFLRSSSQLEELRASTQDLKGESKLVFNGSSAVLMLCLFNLIGSGMRKPGLCKAGEAWLLKVV